MLKFTYYKKANLLESKLTGDASIHDILSHYSYVEKIIKNHYLLKILIDCRGCKINVHPKDLDLILPQLTKTTENVRLLKEAILVDLPQSTVIATMFQDKYGSIKRYKFSVFSTEDAARIWLGVD